MADYSWQARAAEGFDAAHFAVDWERRHVTCPRGQPSVKWIYTHDRHDNEVIHVEFARRACLACPDRLRCTQSASEPRMVTFRPKEQHRAMQQARQRQATEAFKDEYARRAGVEGTLSQGVRAFNLRRARYIGLARTHVQHVAMAAAINVHRLADWWSETPRARTRQSTFAALAA